MAQLRQVSSNTKRNAKQLTPFVSNAWVASLTAPRFPSRFERMIQSGDISNISQRLEVGRKALETLASIASQLENAKDGLVRSAYLTANIDELPPGIRRLWESLDKDVMVMPAPELAKKLQHLERMLALRLATVMPTVEKICAAENRGEEIEVGGMRAQLHDLSRLASTALAIRLLAHRKNFKFPPGQLPISADVLRDKALRVKKIERVHKLRVLTHIHDMVKATVGMLSNDGIDATTKTMLRGVLRDLQSNARHLADGGSFSNLPVPIENVELSEAEQNELSELSLIDEPLAFPPAEKPPVAAQAPAKEAQPSTPKATQKSKTASQPIATSAPIPIVPSKRATRPSSAQVATVKMNRVSLNPIGRFWRHLRTWIKAPMGVTWREAGSLMDDDN